MAVVAEEEQNRYFDLKYKWKCFLHQHNIIFKIYLLVYWFEAMLFGDDVFPYNAKIESVVSLFFVAVVGWLKKFSSSVERPNIGSIVCWIWGEVVVEETDALKKLLNGSVESELEDVKDVSINVGFESLVGVSV